MKYLMFLALSLVLVSAVGCKKPDPTATAKAIAPNNGDGSNSEPQPPTRGPGSITATHAPVVISENADTSAVLGQLSLELRRYVLRSQIKPKNFEEFVNAAEVQAPPPPSGKKYAIQGSTVVLVKR